MEYIFFENAYEHDYFVITEAKENRFKNLMQKLNFIKKATKDEYDGDKEVKKFIDKHYDDIKKVSELLETKFEDITLEKSILISSVVAVLLYAIGGISIVAGGMILANVSIIGIIISLLFSAVSSIILLFKKYKDNKLYNEVKKVKTGLLNLRKKVKNDKKVADRIDNLIAMIDDAEEAFKGKNILINNMNGNSVNIVSESTYDAVYEALQDKVNSGELTLETAEYLNDIAYELYS